MKASVLTCIIVALAATVKIDIERRSINGSGKVVNSMSHNTLAKGSNVTSTVSSVLFNNIYMYFATLYVGSDNQKITPQVDTGSSDLWFLSQNSPYCQNNPNCNNRLYDPQSSSTFKNLSTPWNIRYFDLTEANGYLAQDEVTMGGVFISNVTFGVAHNTTVNADVIGIGFPSLEGDAILLPNGTFSNTYANFPLELKNQGLINTVAYSLYLNSDVGMDGNILFGGVDHAKYTGELGLVPMINIWSPYTDFQDIRVMMNGINAISSTGTNCSLVSNAAFPVLLDSGSSFGMLPSKAVKAIAEMYNYTLNEDIGYYQGFCNVSTFEFLELDFSGIRLSVPIQSLVAASPDPDPAICLLAISPAYGLNEFILGDVFLRNFYVVYDLENYQVGLAQARYSDESNIEDIISTIPSATSAPAYQATNIIIGISINDMASCKPLTSTEAFSSSTTYPITQTASSSSFPSTLNHSSNTVGVSSNSTMWKYTTTANATQQWHTGNDLTSGGSTTLETPTVTYGQSSTYQNSATSLLPTTTVYKNSTLREPQSSPIIQASTARRDGINGTVTVSSDNQYPSWSSSAAEGNGSTFFSVSISALVNKTNYAPALATSTGTYTSFKNFSSTTETPLLTTYASISSVYYVENNLTDVVEPFTVTFSGPGVFSANGAEYTVVDKTTLEVTKCPCTMIKTATESQYQPSYVSVNGTMSATINNMATHSDYFTTQQAHHVYTSTFGTSERTHTEFAFETNTSQTKTSASTSDNGNIHSENRNQTSSLSSVTLESAYKTLSDNGYKSNNTVSTSAEIAQPQTVGSTFFSPNPTGATISPPTGPLAENDAPKITAGLGWLLLIPIVI